MGTRHQGDKGVDRSVVFGGVTATCCIAIPPLFQPRRLRMTWYEERVRELAAENIQKNPRTVPDELQATVRHDPFANPTSK